MEILVAIAGKLAEYTVEPICRQVGYLAHYNTNHRNLQTRLHDLEAARDEVQHKIDQVKRGGGKRIETTVLNWKARVDAIILEAEEFLKDGRHAQTKCLHGFCPHLVLRYQLSKKLTKFVEEIDQLCGKKEFSNFAYDVPSQEVCLLSTGDYSKFDSRNSIVMRVMDELRNVETEMILVYGIGGVGKTTLVVEVLRQVVHENLFDDVVMVRDVKENPDLEKIQKEIATKLGMSIENHTLAERAPKLCDRIKDKRILVVLDDVWEKIDLVAIGIPRMVNCKLLLTSRTRKELSYDTRKQIDISLDVLNEDEAWNLFEKMTGDVVKDSHIRSVAIEVAMKCGRLPILIVTVARALKDRRQLSAWKDTMRRLENFDNKELNEKTYLALEWSYNQLEEEELKPLFLLCGIIVVQNHICLSDLLKYSFGLGLIKNVNTIEEARDALDVLIEKLKDSCLLLESDENRHVRMHDLVSEVAVWIAKKEHHVLSVEYGGELKKWPDHDFFGRCSKMSLKSSNIPMLSQVPAGECRKLEMFCLYTHESFESVQIPSNFFREMEKLKVLGFTSYQKDKPWLKSYEKESTGYNRVRTVSLPSSLEFLINLQSLCLENCVLEDIALVGHLRNLEILSFARSDIKQLPEEIGQLVRLRWLDLSDCEELQVISPGVISRLERLEELTMRNVFLKWGEAVRGRRNASLLELMKNLSQLTALEIYIGDANILPSNLFSSKLVRYQIYIGNVWRPDNWWTKTMTQTTLNRLKLQLAPGYELDEGIIILLKRSEDLSLDGTEGVNSVVRQLHVEDFQQLIHLHLQNNVDFTCIINKKVVFPNLTTLIVYRCDHLRYLLSSSMAKSLVELKHLEVSCCEIMEEIVSTRDQPNGEDINAIFCKLESLRMYSLPDLARFCTERSTEVAPVKKFDTEVGAESGTKLDAESETAVLICLFDAQIKFPSLERLKIEWLPKLQTLWNNKLADQDSFRRLKEVDVSGCFSLINIFVPQMMGRLNGLETLDVGDCRSLMVIFEGETDVKERHAETSSSTYHLRPAIYCQNLGSVRIGWCHSLKNIFPASVARGLQKLHLLQVMRCNQVEEIILGEQGPTTKPPQFVFPKVTHVIFHILPKLCRFYPGMHASKWPLLKELELRGCPKVKIFAAELQLLPEKHELDSLIEQPLFLIDQDSFPNLEKLELAVPEIWYGASSPALFFSKLESISFYRWTPFPNQAAIEFFQKLPKLTTLYVGCNDSTEILLANQETNAGKEIQPVSGTSVKTLLVCEMSKLLQIGNWAADPLFPNLDTLYVENCGKLKSVESSAISFRNLTNLEVHYCDGLEYVTSYSVAKSLTQLTQLTVGNCKMLTEIIRGASNNEDDRGICEIAFPRLQHLHLWNLRSLRGFCSGNCIVTVPSSTELRFSGCPFDFKISSEGVLLGNPIQERIQISQEKDYIGDHAAEFWKLFSRHTFLLQDIKAFIWGPNDDGILWRVSKLNSVIIWIP